MIRRWRELVGTPTPLLQILASEAVLNAKKASISAQDVNATQDEPPVKY